MSEPIRVEASTDDRTPEQAARAAPVALPAGSYDSAELQKALDEAGKAKNDGARDELVAAALEKHNEIGTEASSLDLAAGYKRVAVVDEATGITENRVVFAGDEPAEAAAPAQAPTPAPEVGAATKGE